MEKLDTGNVYEKTRDCYPEWAIGMDGLQAGFNRRGELVAYDYANGYVPRNG